MNNILTLKPLQNSRDIQAFRKFVDKISIELRCLENLGQNLEHISSVLCVTIMKLLPHDILLEINSLSTEDTYSNINILLKAISQSLHSRERTHVIKSSVLYMDPNQRSFRQKGNESSASKMNSSRDINVKKDLSTFSSSDLLMTHEKDYKQILCFFCESRQHSTDKCELANKLTNEEKISILRKKGVCFGCLSRSSHVKKNCKKEIKCNKCFGTHPDVLCFRNNSSRNHLAEASVKEKENKVLSIQNFCSDVFLQTLVVTVSEKGLQGNLRLIIDTGSQNNYISKYAAKMLKLEKIRTEKIKHGLFGGVEMIEDHDCYQFNLSGLDGKHSCKIEALDQKKICSSIPRMRNNEFIEILENRGIHITDVRKNGDRCLFEEDPEEIHLLLGAGTAAHLFTGKVEHIPGFEIAAFETLLGWTLMGRMENRNANIDSSLAVVSLSLLVADAKLADLWRLDAIGISGEENKTKIILEEETQKHFLDTVRRDNTGRYEVTLPWTVDSSVLSSNRSLAEKSLYKTEAKLLSINKRKEYQDIFDYWEANEIIESVTEGREQRVHFLPHRPVIKEASETTKIRPVFNASAHSKNTPSLNDCLTKGPNLIEIVPSILNRFRKYPIGISSDIEKAFCQIKIAEKDRDFLRFLWFDAEHNLKIYRHSRVVFGLTSSPFLLAATLNHLLDAISGEFKETSQILRESFYIDNSLVSLNDIEKAEKFVHESKKILASAHFNLRCWRSNIPLALIDDLEDKPKIVPVLGLIWDLERDCLTCKFEETYKFDEPLTKRKVLSVTQRVYDPIGFTAPVTLTPKLILQETWIQKIKWDDELPAPLNKQFRQWLGQLHLLPQVEIPRWLNVDFENEKENTIELHVFSDASKRAYATCVYLRVKTLEGIKVQLVSARSRVAPIKEVTIPRLELLSCLIGARLAKTIISDLKLVNCHTVFWSDSSTALAWIRRDQAWGTFVHNRVKEIRTITNIQDWRHVPGNLNPADLPSRGCSFEQLQKSKWWEGPSWLYLPETEWPQAEEQPDERVLNVEKRKTILSLLDKKSDSNWYYRYFSSYKKIVRMLAWILRFAYNLRNNDKNLARDIGVDEFERAEKTLCKLIQSEEFSGISDPNIRTLRPVEDEWGVFRAQTKIIQRQDTINFRYPIILPSNHPVVQRLIYEKHIENQHAGVSILMAHIRENYWILKSRKTIRNVIRKCVRCKRFTVPRVEVEPGMPPEDRVKEASVFEVVGVDLAGPLHLADGSKSWIVLFTCANYRTIHLELVSALSTAAFLQSLRRFVARRGRPYVIYSDNGTNFVGTNKALEKINWNAISSAASTQKIRWKFNPPTAAWWGGWWERLVRMVKEILRRVLGRASLNYEELSTILCDCEQVINSRPLTYVTEDNRDLTPLTPMNFLQELPSAGVPDIDIVDSRGLNRRAKYRQRIRDDLRSRFRTEYLGQLKHQAFRKNKYQQLRVGDVVLVEDINKRRLHWPLAKIIEILPGSDNIVRLVKIQTQNGIFLRPTSRLFPLEISSSDDRIHQSYSRTLSTDQIPQDGQTSSVPVVPRTPKELSTPELSSAPPIVTRTGRVVKQPDRLSYTN